MGVEVEVVLVVESRDTNCLYGVGVEFTCSVILVFRVDVYVVVSTFFSLSTLERPVFNFFQPMYIFSL